MSVPFTVWGPMLARKVQPVQSTNASAGCGNGSGGLIRLACIGDATTKQYSTASARMAPRRLFFRWVIGIVPPRAISAESKSVLMSLVQCALEFNSHHKKKY